MASYSTVLKSSSAEIEVKRSRFIASLVHADSQEAAVRFIKSVRTANRDARHNIYAYRLYNGNLFKYSDDGEPSGTGGKPVYDILAGNGLFDVCIVVTRYFGGVLLGTGGLSRAYSDAARFCVEAAEITAMKEYSSMKCSCDYPLYSRIMSLISSADGKQNNSEFNEKVDMDFLIPIDNVASFNKNLTEATLGKTTAIETGSVFLPENKSFL